MNLTVSANSINSKFVLDGPFRIDRVICMPKPGLWRFTVKLVVRVPGPSASLYATMMTGCGGSGLYLSEIGTQEEFLPATMDPHFRVPGGASPREAGFLLAQCLTELGISPMYDQRNEITPVEPERFSDLGVVGLYRT